ncbi:lycopene cyclase domain-containing protein [Natrinema pallidum]|uniref:lycopene cyclase domain-containing protein n=1 Tax=Natrinema pallidum TaxID=69527 RepID=UPI003743EE5C
MAKGVWWYGDGAVLATVWRVPLEEYLFFVFQPVLTSLWLCQWIWPINRSLWLPRSHRGLGGVGGLAIELGIWVISEAHTTGYVLGGLPIEEALFFLVTNVFAVQGVVLYLCLLDRRHEIPSVEGLRNGTLSAGD